MRDVTPGDVLTAQYSTLARAGVSAAAAKTWNPRLRRTTRILVPMDVQALVVTKADGEPDAQVLSQLPDPAPDASGGTPDLPKVAPFTDGPPRTPGVYLHWAAADGLAGSQAQAQAPGAAAAAPAACPRSRSPTAGSWSGWPAASRGRPALGWWNRSAAAPSISRPGRRRQARPAAGRRTSRQRS